MKDVLLGGLYSVIGIPVYELGGTSATINVSIEVPHILVFSLAVLYIQANNITTVGITANIPCVLSPAVSEIYDGTW